VSMRIKEVPGTVGRIFPPLPQSPGRIRQGERE
jgi:hypothetical protein